MKRQSMTQEFSDSWNMNQAFLMRLDERLDDANRASNEGHLTAWYRCLRTIYRIIHHKIDHDKDKTKIKKTLSDDFKKAQGLLKVQVGKSYQVMMIDAAELTLDEIDIQLNDLIIKYGLIKLTKDTFQKGSAIKEKFHK